jgi:hypothetical protein
MPVLETATLVKKPIANFNWQPRWMNTMFAKQKRTW